MNQHPATQASCKLCRSDRPKGLYQLRCYGVHVGRCPGCGLEFVLEQPTEGQFKEVYVDEQGFERFSDLMSNAYVRDRQASALRDIREFMLGSTVPTRFFLGRRITLAQLQEFSAQAMRRALAAVGFDLLRMDVVCEFGFPVTAYRESLGVPTTVRSPLAAALDWLTDRGLFFRNNMRVFWRKPLQ